MKGLMLGTFLLGLGICPAIGQTPQLPGHEPVQAELLANLNVRKVASGKVIFARVTQDWKGQDCALQKGAILEGAVEESVPRLGKNESKLALSFKSAQCNGREMQPLDLVLTVIAQAPMDWSSLPDSQFTMTMDFPNPHPMGPTGNQQSTLQTGQNTSTLSYDISHLALTRMELSGIDHHFPRRKNVRPGDVLDLKGLDLNIGTGPNRSSVISSKGRDVFLAEFTQFLLMPPTFAFRSPSARLVVAGLAPGRDGGSSVGFAPPAAPSIPQPNDIEICAPPGCAVDLRVSAQELESHTVGSIGTRALGYTPNSNKAVARFADEESLVWLGPGQLLFAFNPHQLIRRGKADQAGTARLIRAVLLNAATHDVVRAVDWEIPDSHRYLWPFDGDRILVHVGNELRVYSSDLEAERSIPLAGPLLFVRIAPSGGLVAVATLRERHSAELHAKLRSELGNEPEEDVDLAILNQDLNPIAKVSTVSNLMPPTLLNEGQVRLQSEPGQWYRLAMSTWENRRSALARFHSYCTPDVTSTAPDLLFLLTCSAPDGNTEYSVLRADGRVLLRGDSNPEELGHEVIGNHRSLTFAVKVVHAERSIFPSTIYKSSELDSEQVRVYRAEDGKRLLAVRVKNPIASHGGYALSPDGSQLAVLAGSDIEFYSVPAN